MAGLALRLILAGVLVVAALSKVAGGRRGQEALATFGIDSGRDRAIASGALIAVELGLAVGVAAGLDAFAWAAALFMLGLSGALVSAIARGRGGEPCGCFGARSTVGWGPVLRNLVLAAGFAAVPFLPADEPATEGWLAIGLAVALADRRREPVTATNVREPDRNDGFLDVREATDADGHFRNELQIPHRLPDRGYRDAGEDVG